MVLFVLENHALKFEMHGDLPLGCVVIASKDEGKE